MNNGCKTIVVAVVSVTFVHQIMLVFRSFPCIVSYCFCGFHKHKNHCFQDFRHVRKPPANLSTASKDSLAGQSVGSLHNVAESHHFSEGTSKKLASSECLADSNNTLDSEDDSSDDESDESKHDDDRSLQSLFLDFLVLSLPTPKWYVLHVHYRYLLHLDSVRPNGHN